MESDFVMVFRPPFESTLPYRHSSGRSSSLCWCECACDGALMDRMNMALSADDGAALIDRNSISSDGDRIERRNIPSPAEGDLKDL